MQVKPGVRFDKFHPSGVAVIVAAEVVWRRLWLGEPTITSGTDGEHMNGSLHYEGRAWDLRSRSNGGTWHPPGVRAEVVRLLREQLGPDFDVIDEGNHYHVEHDPKG